MVVVRLTVCSDLLTSLVIDVKASIYSPIKSPSNACIHTSYTLSTRICELIDGSVFLLLFGEFSSVFNFSSDFSLFMLDCEDTELDLERTEPDRERRIELRFCNGVAKTIRAISSILHPKMVAAFCANSIFLKYGFAFGAKSKILDKSI